MAKEKNAPKTTELMLDHVIEEASEVIKAAIKIKRFGLNNSKFSELAAEVDDVQTTFKRYRLAVLGRS